MSGNNIKTSQNSLGCLRGNYDGPQSTNSNDLMNPTHVINEKPADMKEGVEQEQFEKDLPKQIFESSHKASQNWFLKAFYYSGTQVLNSSPFEDVNCSSPSTNIKNASFCKTFDDGDYTDDLSCDFINLALDTKNNEKKSNGTENLESSISNERKSTAEEHSTSFQACMPEPSLGSSDSDMYVHQEDSDSLLPTKISLNGTNEPNLIDSGYQKYTSFDDSTPELMYYGNSLPPPPHYEVNFPVQTVNTFTPGYNGAHEIDYPMQFIHYGVIPPTVPPHPATTFAAVVRHRQVIIPNSYRSVPYASQYVGNIQPFSFKKQSDINKLITEQQIDYLPHADYCDEIVDLLPDSAQRKTSSTSNNQIYASDDQATDIKKSKNFQKNGKVKAPKAQNTEISNVVPSQTQSNIVPKQSVIQVTDNSKKNHSCASNESNVFKDLGGNVLSLARDQHGSRLIQLRLEKASEDDISQFVVDLISDPQDLVMLMGDVFGNYVIQKLLEHGNDKHKITIAKTVQGRILDLTLQMYGCRVIQKAIECIPLAIQIELVMELKNHVLTCIQDQNGNHVIQKCIECIAPIKLQFIIDEIQSKVALLSMHPYGCRVIQRIMEFFDRRQRILVIKQLLYNLSKIILDQYGNYVIQHAYDNYVDPDHRKFIFDYVKDNLYFLSSHKFASNVVEKCLTSSHPIERRLLVLEVINNSFGSEEDIVFRMMKDGYANYVVQKMLDTTISDHDIELYNMLVSKIRPHYPSLKKLSYGKHIINKIDKICSKILSKNTTDTNTPVEGSTNLSIVGGNSSVNISSGIHSCSSNTSVLSYNIITNNKAQVTLDSLTEFPKLINSGMSSM